MNIFSDLPVDMSRMILMFSQKSALQRFFMDIVNWTIFRLGEISVICIDYSHQPFHTSSFHQAFRDDASFSFTPLFLFKFSDGKTRLLYFPPNVCFWFYRKAFVGGLTPDTTEEDLKTYFGAFGEVQHAVVKRDPASGRSRCFAFVTFAYADGLTKVCVNRNLK